MGYSAHVEIYLLAGNRTHPVSQVRDGSMILTEPHDFGDGEDAQLVIKIDGRPILRDIFVTGGASRVARYF